ncbi:MAG: DUF2065 domain-containing protein [Rhizobiales bacterium]|nr:DUF2065 domain-containing protein [Hyphomicrobiales bacterium]
MKDFLTALGLVLVIEGILLAALPMRVRQALEIMRLTPIQQLRIIGLVSAILGLGVIWWMRS